MRTRSRTVIGGALVAVALLYAPSAAGAAGLGPEHFIPKRYRVTHQVIAKIDSDNIDDVALIARDDDPGIFDATDRRLYVLRGLPGGSGGYIQMGYGPLAVVCSKCGGRFQKVELEVSNRRIVLTQSWGSDVERRDVLTFAHRGHSGVRLVHFDELLKDRYDGSAASTAVDFLTGERTITIYLGTPSENKTTRRLDIEPRALRLVNFQNPFGPYQWKYLFG